MQPPRYPNDEERVISAFVRYLEAEGWSIVRSRPSVNEPDLMATRGDQHLVAEAKGRTAAPRTDIDTMYGQLLRRMRPNLATTYAAVLPSSFVARALDVPIEIRHMLRIALFEVTDDGWVIPH